MLTTKKLRELCRYGKYTSATAKISGYVQANLVILPKSYAFDFLLFCHRNPKPCPLLEVLDAGNPHSKKLAPGANICTDLPRYHIFNKGKLQTEEVDIQKYWRKDLVSFLLGCSFTFEAAMQAADLPVRHIEENRNVPMYCTKIPCHSAGDFAGKQVVSMRPMPGSKIAQTVQLTACYPKAHGAPIHIGDPQEIGIENLARPDYGEAVTVHPGEIPVFWSCGVTPQAIIVDKKIDFAITHAPGHMFVTDLEHGKLKNIYAIKK